MTQQVTAETEQVGKTQTEENVYHTEPAATVQ